MKYIPDDLIDIRYVGPKLFKRDTVCGTGLRWEQGETKTISKEIGLKLAKFSGVWKRVDNKKRSKTPKEPAKPTDKISEATKLDIEANNILASKETSTNFDPESILVSDKSEEGLPKSAQMADNKMEEIEA